jgi:hypothetical protein
LEIIQKSWETIWKSLEIFEIIWKSLKSLEIIWKSLRIIWKFLKLFRNPWKSFENLWKSRISFENHSEISENHLYIIRNPSDIYCCCFKSFGTASIEDKSSYFSLYIVTLYSCFIRLELIFILM